jgi:hypothetical protein
MIAMEWIRRRWAAALALVFIVGLVRIAFYYLIYEPVVDRRGSPVGVEFEPLRPLLVRVGQVEYLSDEPLDHDPLLPRQFDPGDMMYARAQYALAPTILAHSGGPLPLVLANFASAKGLERAIASGRYDVLLRPAGNIALLSRK